MVEGGRFELPNPKERIYSPPRLATSLPLRHIWWRMTGSNRRPPACKAGALPAELIPPFCLATSYSHRDKVPTTIGARELNFRVRYGNGCDLSAIITRLYSFKTRIILTHLLFKSQQVFLYSFKTR